MSQSSSRPKITRSAACNCGQVQITVTGVDKSAVHCYCVNCQRATGTAFAHNHRFVEAELIFEKGEDVVKQYADGDTNSGNIIYRHFCSNCVSSSLTDTLFQSLAAQLRRLSFESFGWMHLELMRRHRVLKCTSRILLCQTSSPCMRVRSKARRHSRLSSCFRRRSILGSAM